MQLPVSSLQLLLLISAQQATHHLTNGFTSQYSPIASTNNVFAFAPRARATAAVPVLSSSHKTSRLMVFSNDSNDDEDDDDDTLESIQPSSESLERARQLFEQMMAMPNDNKETNEKEIASASPDADERYILATKTINKAVLSNRHSPPPLTAILRERRLKEIQLLGTLAHSDEAVNELWALWIAERGPASASNILHVEQLMSVESWNDAEVLLLSLIEEHGLHWAEPVNRLATLYYMLGRYQESKALCEIVLDTKPWHFGALSGIVLVCTAMNDASGARLWADQRLPPPGDRRTAWTQRAIENAKESLRQASLVGRSREIGQEEIMFRQFRAQLENNLRGDFGEDGDGGSDGEASFDAWA
jgi:hypothetical protein